MSWIDRLDRKIGKKAPKNLIVFILALYTAGFVINLFKPGFYASYLCLNIEMVFKGQLWRLITWLMYPSSSFIIFILTLYVYSWIGKALSTQWGDFQFDLYYVCGILLHIMVVMLLYVITGIPFIVTPEYLNLSMFMAYAVLFPDRMVLLFFILPIRSIFLAVIDLIYFAAAIFQGAMHLRSFINLSAALSADLAGPYYYVCDGIAALSSLLIFAIFYFSGKSALRPSIADRKRKKEFQRKMNSASNTAGNDAKRPKIIIVNPGNGANAAKTEAFRHKCEICGRTDISNPELEFRYCSKCNGVHEYCMDHLYTHTHILGEE